jgi:predicted nucleotidyltransferase
MTKENILEFLEQNKKNFLNKYQISNIALFGSYARDEEDKESDIDIAIETTLTDYFKLYDFKEELENFFKLKVDVIRLRDRMNESLKKRIANEGIYV